MLLLLWLLLLWPILLGVHSQSYCALNFQLGCNSFPFYHNSDQLYLMKIIFSGVTQARALLLRPTLQKKWGCSTRKTTGQDKFQSSHKFFKFYQNFAKITIEIVIFGLAAKEEAQLLGPILQVALLQPLYTETNFSQIVIIFIFYLTSNNQAFCKNSFFWKRC